MKRLSHALAMLVVIGTLLALFQNSPALAVSGPGSAAEGDPACVCSYPGDRTPGKNGFSCLFPGDRIRAPSKNFCPVTKVCNDTPHNGPRCDPIPKATINENDCYCTHPGDKNSGRNGITCKDGTGRVLQDTKFCTTWAYCADSQTKTTDGQHFVYACQSLNCSCEHPNTPGAGLNGMKCVSTITRPVGGGGTITTPREVFCQENEVCVGPGLDANGNPQTNGNAVCQALNNCTCDHPGQGGSGNNGYNCIVDTNPDGTGGATYHAYCPDASLACQQNGKKISCAAVNLNQTGTGPTAPPLPPPPPPPCASFDAAGRCTAVVTALSLATGNGSGGTSTDPISFINQLFQILLGVGGGVALLLIMFSGYKLMVSQGKPEAIQQAREQLIAAIVGILFLIFSIAILEAIGVDILHIPGLGK